MIGVGSSAMPSGRLIDGLGEIVTRRQTITLLAHPDLEIID
jgi:hypothetical protein